MQLGVVPELRDTQEQAWLRVGWCMSVATAQGFNKWQNGFVSPADGCVYAIPCNAEYVLRIDPRGVQEAGTSSTGNQQVKLIKRLCRLHFKYALELYR